MVTEEFFNNILKDYGQARFIIHSKFSGKKLEDCIYKLTNKTLNKLDMSETMVYLLNYKDFKYAWYVSKMLNFKKGV